MLLSHLAQTGLVYSLGYIRLADFFMLIGRLSMPIFSFLIAQGIGLSSDKKKYLLRLLIFALISEIAYDLAFRGNMLDFSNQNVFFSLFLGGFFAYTIGKVKSLFKNKLISALLIGFSFIGISYISILIRSDYSYKAVFAIGLLYLFRKSRALSLLAVLIGFYFSAHTRGYILDIPYMVYLSLPLIFLYNGKRGSYSKWAFYLFYPSHLLLIYLIKSILF